MSNRGNVGIVTSALGLVFSLALLAALTACQGLEKGLSGPVPASPEELIAELEAEKDRIDKRTDTMMQRIEAFNSSRSPGDRKVQFSELFYTDLDPAQRDILNDLLAQEKHPSFKNLLTQIIEDRNRIQQMQERIQYLEQALPDDFIIVKKGESHYALAMDYLQREGVTPERAKELVDQISLQDELVPGFKVWFNYRKDEDSFKTYVTRGEAGQTPLAVARATKRNLIRERDTAVARSTALEHTKRTLEQDISRLQQDILTLEDRRSELTVQVADLEARNGDLEERGNKLTEDLGFAQNSLHYHADSEQALAQQGILTKFLKNLRDVKGVVYDEAIDLRQAKSISFTPNEYGLRDIKAVEIWPEIYKSGRDYFVEIAANGLSATLVINDPNLFKKQRVLISLRGTKS